MTRTDEEIAGLLRHYISGSDHPDLLIYRKDFETKFDVGRWIKEMRKRCEISDLRGKQVLEVGCGFGWDAVGLSVICGSRVVATDILPSMISGMKECLASMSRIGISLDIEAVQGDICDLDLPAGSFDAVYSSEAVEHVHDLSAMFRRCWHLLKPGGTIAIYNDSNQLNSRVREDTVKMWKERDESPDHAAWLAAEVRPIEHMHATPYRHMRSTMISEATRGLSPGEQSKLEAATAGMIRPEIAQAVKTFLDDGNLPTPPEFSWCRNPETGEYAERLLNPFEMVEMLRDSGFRDVKLRHGFSRFPHRLLNGTTCRPLNKFLFERRPSFALHAIKR